MPPKTVATPEQIAEDLADKVVDNSTKKSRYALRKGKKEFRNKLIKVVTEQITKPDFEK